WSRPPEGGQRAPLSRHQDLRLRRLTMLIRSSLIVCMALGLAPAAFAIVNPPFDDLLRGDANNDLTVDVSDPVAINSWLFLGQPAPVCADAADANDDGEVDVTDSIYLYVYLFLGGPPP